jgi:hypothetical protein
MPAYRLYILDDTSHIRASEIVEAETDSEAMRVANEALDGRAAELWLKAKKVCTFSRGTGKNPLA